MNVKCKWINPNEQSTFIMVTIIELDYFLAKWWLLNNRCQLWPQLFQLFQLWLKIRMKMWTQNCWTPCTWLHVLTIWEKETPAMPGSRSRHCARSRSPQPSRSSSSAVVALNWKMTRVGHVDRHACGCGSPGARRWAPGSWRGSSWSRSITSSLAGQSRRKMR